VLVALAAAVDRLGLFQEAVLSCDHALEVDDEYSDTWFIKGLALFRLSQYTESGSCFQMLVEMDHSPAEAWFMKGNCHYHLGEFTIAIRCYDPDPQEIPKISLQYGRCPCTSRAL
jgi:tetratricopeptide (TPR) repeat protein